MYVRTPTLSKFRLQGSSESVPYLKSSSMATLLGVYFYLLSLAIFFFLAAGSQVPSVLWLTIISTTWSRKRAHVMQVRLKMRVSPCASPPPPSLKIWAHAPPAPAFVTYDLTKAVGKRSHHVQNCWWMYFHCLFLEVIVYECRYVLRSRRAPPRIL